MNVRLIVLSKIPKSVNNELWRLFSGRAEVVEEAISHYQENYRKSEYSILMQQLYEFYIKEKLPMTYTLEQFKKDFIISHLREIPTEEVLKLIQLLYEFYVREKLPMTYTLEQFKRDFVISYLRDVPTEEVFKQYSLEEVLKQYSPEQVLKQYSPHDLLEGLSPETLQHLAVILGVV